MAQNGEKIVGLLIKTDKFGAFIYQRIYISTKTMNFIDNRD